MVLTAELPNSAPNPPKTADRRRHRLPNERVEVLQGNITQLRVELAGLEMSGQHEHERDIAQSHLNQANDYLESKDINNAWVHLYRAREALIQTYGAAKLASLARVLCAEIDGDRAIATWRVRAVKELLLQDLKLRDTGGHSAEELHDRQERLQRAYNIRDEGKSEIFVQLAIHRHFQLALSGIGVPVLIATIWLVGANAHHFADPDWKANSAIPCWLAVMFGIVGAIVSAAQRSSTVSTLTIADYLQLFAATTSRIPIGGVSGITVWLFSVAAVGDGAGGLNIANMLLAAFGAGFAERLVVQGSKIDKSGAH